jgi:chromosome partitioning protein
MPYAAHMALTIVVELLKGGAGKTTVSVALAEAAAGTGVGLVTLVDADPMGSSLRWSQLAEEDGRPLISTVVGLPSQDLSRRLGSVTHGSAIVVVDTPPPGNLRIASSAIEVADVVVMPTPASMADLDRVPPTVDAVRKAGKPLYSVLTRVRNGADRDSAIDALKSWGVPPLDTELRLSVDVARNYGRPPAGILARFGRELLDEVTTRMDVA